VFAGQFYYQTREVSRPSLEFRFVPRPDRFGLTALKTFEVYNTTKFEVSYRPHRLITFRKTFEVYDTTQFEDSYRPHRFITFRKTCEVSNITKFEASYRPHRLTIKYAFSNFHTRQVHFTFRENHLGV